MRIPFEERLRLEPSLISDLKAVRCGARTGRSAEGHRLEQGGGGTARRGKDLLIPCAVDCVGIDIAARRIEVELPEGLKDLNRS